MKLDSDGLRVRPARIWTREKLAYLRKYAAAFMVAMANKRGPEKWDRLVYLDLLCGPGRDIDTDTDQEFLGSPLIALSIEPPFDHLYFADKDAKNLDALRRRIPSSEEARITLRVGDCNVVVDEVLRSLSGRTLGLAFIDPEGFEVNFATLAKLAKRRIDLLYLFPSGIGVKRNLKNFLPLAESPMDKFWGGRDWRDLPEARRLRGTSIELNQERIVTSLVSAFRRKLKTAGFSYQDEAAPLFSLTQKIRRCTICFTSRTIRSGLRSGAELRRSHPAVNDLYRGWTKSMLSIWLFLLRRPLCARPDDRALRDGSRA